MFADLIIAGFIATAGGWHAPADAPRVEPAVIRSSAERADRETSQTMLHLAADLGCPRYRGGYYDDHRGYPHRCRRRHADPYHDPRSDRYSRHDDDYRTPDHHRRYGERHHADPDHDDHRHGDSPYRAEPDDRLLDRDGRPYSHSRDFQDDDVPPYRRGAYDPAFERDPDFGRFDEAPPRGVTDERFRDSRPRLRDNYYHRSSYHGYDRKKKATTTTATMTTEDRRLAV
jgi:hypothetical protein